MAGRAARKIVPEWATRIISLRRRLKVSQGELALRVGCSAMTVSRWERALQPPSAELYLQLGMLARKAESWFFWELAGLRMPEVERALPNPPHLKGTRAARRWNFYLKSSKVVPFPILKAFAGAHGQAGAMRLSLERIPSIQLMGVPAGWCPNPDYTSLLRVKGHSMGPLVRNGDMVAVDSLQHEQSQLDGKIVIATSEKNGLCLSRFRHFDGVDVLEPVSGEHQSIILGKRSGWRIVGRVLWWISAAP